MRDELLAKYAGKWVAVHKGRVIAVADEPLSIMEQALAEDGYLATGGRDGTARIWNLSSGQEWVRLKHGSTVETVAFGVDGTTLTTGSYHGALMGTPFRTRTVARRRGE